MPLLRLCMLLVLTLPLITIVAQTEYASESGFYSATLPAGWDSVLSNIALHLSREDESTVSMRLLELPPDEPKAVIQQAFKVLRSAPGDLVSSVDAPLPNGVWKQEIYASGDWLHIALAQARDDRALALVVIGDQADIQTVNPQILSLLNSIEFGKRVWPDYVHRAEYEEFEVNIGDEPFVLSGTLSMPAGEGPFPAAVIVHGSGPQNRDGQVGPLSAYRDIAVGLASHGVAVLRYDKRTFSYATQITINDAFTIDSESTDDALHAINVLREQERIDPERLFIIGHSQGGSVTPRILERDSDIAGGIMLAAATRPFSVILNEQLAYINEQNPTAADNPEMAYFQILLDQFAQVAAGASYAEAFGDFAVYMLSLESLDPVAEARDIAAPLLILQGERDYQVTMEDFEGWQDAYSDDERVTLHSYPLLNHMFNSSGDPSRLSVPQDYEILAFVDWDVIETIVEWIRGDASH